jgi:hypothetical protein
VDLGLCAERKETEEERGVGRGGSKRLVTPDGDVAGRMRINLETQ